MVIGYEYFFAVPVYTVVLGFESKIFVFINIEVRFNIFLFDIVQPLRRPDRPMNPDHDKIIQGSTCVALAPQNQTLLQSEGVFFIWRPAGKMFLFFEAGRKKIRLARATGLYALFLSCHNIFEAKLNIFVKESNIQFTGGLLWFRVFIS